ncbi:MAG: hypothetical protein IPH41_13680 [Sulfuritalea sp.]|nr:hypothetical protein [Sulfuritalea sp.]
MGKNLTQPPGLESIFATGADVLAVKPGANRRAAWTPRRPEVGAVRRGRAADLLPSHGADGTANARLPEGCQAGSRGGQAQRRRAIQAQIHYGSRLQGVTPRGRRMA